MIDQGKALKRVARSNPGARYRANVAVGLRATTREDGSKATRPVTVRIDSRVAVHLAPELFPSAEVSHRASQRARSPPRRHCALHDVFGDGSGRSEFSKDRGGVDRGKITPASADAARAVLSREAISVS